ncbi:MAG: hypothetical protein AB9834_00125 [Lentimicrobium sp.]
MDVSEIVTAFGAYYESSGQNKNRILGMLTQGIVTPGICTAVKTDDTIYKMAQLAIQKIVQSFQKGWTPKNAAAFTPNELKLFHFKVDEEIWPDDVEATWLGFLSSDSVSRQDWPLIKFLIEHPDQGYLAKISSDMELEEYAKGVYTAPTSGVAGDTGKSMDGLIIQLQRGVNDLSMNSITLGALDEATIFDQVETFVDGIAETYQQVQMDVCMSPRWVRAYHRDKRAAGYYDYKSSREINSEIDFTPMAVRALPSLSGTDVIFATPKVNLLHLTKKSKNKTNIKIEEYRRNVSFYCDWWEGIGFGINGAVWTNLLKP